MFSKANSPHSPEYSRAALDHAVCSIKGMARGIIEKIAPEWCDRDPFSIANQSWEERERASFGEADLLAELFGNRAEDRIRAVDARATGSFLRIEEIQPYVKDNDSMPGDLSFIDRKLSEHTVLKVHALLPTNEHLTVSTTSAYAHASIFINKMPFASVLSGELSTSRCDLTVKPEEIAAKLRNTLDAINEEIRLTILGSRFRGCSSNWSEWSVNTGEYISACGSKEGDELLLSLAKFKLPSLEGLWPRS